MKPFARAVFTTFAAMFVLVLVAADTPTDLDKRVAKKLEDLVPINFQANKLINVLDYFRNTTGVRFFIDWEAMEAVGIKQDQRITLKLEKASAASALKQVLEQASERMKEPAGYAIIDGVVHVSTKSGLQKIAEKTKGEGK